MEVTSPRTPRKIYYNSNICVICGFSFIQTEVTATGRTIERNHTNKKLKLSDERVKKIKQVINNFIYEHEHINGVCKKCYSHIEKVLKLHRDVESLEKELNETRSGVRRSYNLTCSKSKSQQKQYEKRLLSPISDRPEKMPKSTEFPPPSTVTLVTMQTFQQYAAESNPSGSTVSEIVSSKTAKKSLFSRKAPEISDPKPIDLSGEVEVLKQDDL